MWRRKVWKVRFLYALVLAFATQMNFALAREPFPPAFSEVRDAYTPSERHIFDRKGRLLNVRRVDPTIRRLEWTSLKDVSPAFKAALLMSEDKRFFKHDGVDWLALSAALIRAPFSKQPRGASTISMQLTRFLKEAEERRTWRRTTLEKIDQIREALALEREWSKDQILEAYLNLVSFRGELQGLRAAAQGLFGKEPHGLDQTESALLAVLIRSPNADAKQVADRACGLLDLKGPSCERVHARVHPLFAKSYNITSPSDLAPVLATKLLPLGRSGSRSDVHTTLDADIQSYATSALREQLQILKKQNAHDGSVLIVENRTGNVLAYVSNGGPGLSSAPYVDGVTAKRQAGSTLKPFIYATAFEKRILTPASLLEDSPADIATGNGGVYRPRNYDNRFHGIVSVRDALGSSLNVPAVRTTMLIGEATALETFHRLGFHDLRSSGLYGPSLALGTLDVSLWELTNAYRTLAQGGWVSPVKIAKEPVSLESLAPHLKSRQVFSPATSFLIQTILSDRESRRLSFGLESPLATRRWSAVKTGTSKDMRDNWCIGFSQRYTVGVWVGNFHGDPMWNVSGVTGAAPIWLDLMEFLEMSHPKPLEPRRPKGVVQAKIPATSDGRDGSDRLEHFLKGTEPRAPFQQAPLRPAILYPVEGLMIAKDPDIPDPLERVPFETNGTDESSFYLNGEYLATAQETFLWVPKEGQHLLELRSANGQTLDQVHFEVR